MVFIAGGRCNVQDRQSAGPDAIDELPLRACGNDAVVWIRQDNHAPPRLILHLRNMIDGVVERLDQWSRLEAAIPMHRFHRHRAGRHDGAADVISQLSQRRDRMSSSGLAHQVKSFEPISVLQAVERCHRNADFEQGTTLVEMVAVELPEPGAAIEVGLNVAVAPVGRPVALRATAALKPPETVVVTVDDPEAP